MHIAYSQVDVRFKQYALGRVSVGPLSEAVQRGPENAGPLNSHRLVLRTLGIMRDLSPDYLRRFMTHADTLLWLEQAHGRLKEPPGKTKPAKAGRVKR